MDAIEQLLRQAELQKIQIEISQRYQKNMAAFLKKFPNIHKTFKNYLIKNLVLKIDANNELNIWNTSAAGFYYADSPREYCCAQVNQYKVNPFIAKLKMGKTPAYNAEHIHIQHLNSLIDKFDGIKIEQSKAPLKYATNMIVSSVGIGYHIQQLINELTINNITIYEQDLDLFFASLHTLDWETILDYFSNNNRSITFCIGVKPTIALAQIETSADTMGLHNLMHTHIFRHANSKNENEFIDLYIKEISNNLSGIGFYDDEQISIAHSLHNLQESVPAFIHHPHKENALPPVLLIGNGPSLDLHIEFIRRNIDNVILISCGSAFGTLSKKGIKPDFHVEMERTIYMKDLLEFGTSAENRKDVTLLCLNTVAPETIALFSDSCMAQKANDASEDLIERYLHPQKIVTLPFSNPTVSNCALSFAISMSFKNVYLIGVDLGFKDDGQHHSQDSPHYDLEKIEKDPKAIYTYSEGRYKIKGNFRESVITHAILNRARVSFERLLHYTNIAFPNFTCFNSNDGVYIEGAIPTPLESISDFKRIDKAKVIATIKSKNFYRKTSKQRLTDIKNNLLTYFFSIENDLLINKNINDEDALHADMARIYALVAKEKDPLTNMLLRGSINCFFGFFGQHYYHVVFTKEAGEILSSAISAYNAFIKTLYTNMHADPYTLDKTHMPPPKEA